MGTSIALKWTQADPTLNFLTESPISKNCLDTGDNIPAVTYTLDWNYFEKKKKKEIGRELLD